MAQPIYAGNDFYKQSIPTDGGSVSVSDSSDLTIQGALYVGSGGTLVVIMRSGATLTFTNVANGTFLPINVSRVKSTGTTCTSILSLA